VIVEWWPAYGDLEPKVKRLCFLGLCVLVGVGAAAGGAAMGFVPWDFATVFWPALTAAVMAFTSGTTVHTRSL